MAIGQVSLLRSQSRRPTPSYISSISSNFFYPFSWDKATSHSGSPLHSFLYSSDQLLFVNLINLNLKIKTIKFSSKNFQIFLPAKKKIRIFKFTDFTFQEACCIYIGPILYTQGKSKYNFLDSGKFYVQVTYKSWQLWWSSCNNRLTVCSLKFLILKHWNRVKKIPTSCLWQINRKEWGYATYYYLADSQLTLHNIINNNL